MKKGDTVGKSMIPCGRKWKLIFLHSARSAACLLILPVVLASCANPGTQKSPANAQTAPSATPATQSEHAAQPTTTKPGNDKAILVYHYQAGNGKPLTGAQAAQLATLLANNKAAAFYQCQPFHCDQPAIFVDGRWLWKQTVPGDYEAIVQVAIDGSTNRAIVNLLNSTINGLP